MISWIENQKQTNYHLNTQDQHVRRLWTSRRLRKGHFPLEQGTYRALKGRQFFQALIYSKDIHRLEVQTSLAFIIGPILFAIGSILQLKNSGSAASMLAIGSIFFTAGGLLQLKQAIQSANKALDIKDRWNWCGIWCALTQSIGTILFNIDTFSAWFLPTINNAPWLALEVVPNFIGSIFFIISAIYGLLEIGHGRLLVINPKHIGWWISIVNAMGCLWFMQAAIASLPLNLTAATILDPQISIRATLLGSIAFTTVGILSLAECSEDFISRLERQI